MRSKVLQLKYSYRMRKKMRQILSDACPHSTWNLRNFQFAATLPHRHTRALYLVHRYSQASPCLEALRFLIGTGYLH